MTSRVLVAETPGLIAATNRQTGVWEFFDGFTSNWRIPRLNGVKVDGAFLTTTVIDLSGYAQQDMTTYFRRSFEQISGPYSSTWDAPIDELTNVKEQTIISSVPLNDDQIVNTLILDSPGFIVNGGYTKSPLVDAGNFDRTHIIHGHQEYHFLTTIAGSTAINANGGGLLTPYVDNYYSSLEPTAADCLYVYRIVLTNPSTLNSHFEQINIPAKRIILDVETGKEDHLEYMMRLARSYELANQV